MKTKDMMRRICGKSLREVSALFRLYQRCKMKYKFINWLLSGFAAVVLWNLAGCQDTTAGKETVNNVGQVILRFSLKLDPNVYDSSYFKKPPQFAIWLEDASKKTIRTVWVTYYTATGDWGSGIVRPVSLPYWVSRWNLETQSLGDPTPENPAVDAVTGATPKTVLLVETAVEAGSLWDYFVEVNVSGDYNETFGANKKDGTSDENGNGQPSIIYKGRINASPGNRSTPRLVGRTDQWQSVDYIIDDLKPITTAKNLLSEIKVSCQTK
jgi:hypothetical protein